MPSTAFGVGILPYSSFEESGVGINSRTISDQSDVNVSLSQVCIAL